jgi:4-hydroxybenzoate polyprenyltransferase
MRALFHFFLFSSLFIAFGAVLMVYQTAHLMELEFPGDSILYFVFFATLCSYNLHWYFTPSSPEEKIRTQWTIKNKPLHLTLAFAGGLGSFIFFWKLKEYWYFILPSVVLTFLYTAPKIPFGPFPHLKKVAIGKTIFLSAVWTYVTTTMPLLIYKTEWQTRETLFCISRFFLIYAICILFDYRDRDADRADGVRSMITYFSEKGIDRLFFFSLLVFGGTTIALVTQGIELTPVIVLIVPGIITGFLYRYAKKNHSDYLYYFVLDGLMVFSSLFTLILPF